MKIDVMRSNIFIHCKFEDLTDDSLFELGKGKMVFSESLGGYMEYRIKNIKNKNVTIFPE